MTGNAYDVWEVPTEFHVYNAWQLICKPINVRNTEHAKPVSYRLCDLKGNNPGEVSKYNDHRFDDVTHIPTRAKSRQYRHKKKKAEADLSTYNRCFISELTYSIPG